jgi:ankyrin repeat protein
MPTSRERVLSHAERNELTNIITRGRHQALTTFLRRDAIKGLRVNDRFPQGLHDGCAPLHLAVARGDERHVTILLTLASANPDARVAGTGTTPLHITAERGHVSATRALLAAGASTTLVNKAGLTALLVAVRHAKEASGHTVVAADLVQAGASLTAQDDSGHTALHAAIDNHDAAYALLQARQPRAC